jgi:hypothetical protein
MRLAGRRGALVRRAVVLATILAAVVGACGSGAAGTGEVSTTAPRGEPIAIRLRLVIADTEGAEVVSTGEVLEGSTVGDAPFCAGGTTEDRHASEDPAVEPYGLLARTITCPDGIVMMAFTPEVVPLGQAQPGSWTIVSGTGAFEGLRGSGAMENVPDPVDDSHALETLTGTVTR